ncbi:alpha/beta hydrolase family protein [Myroides sp. LJL115]
MKVIKKHIQYATFLLFTISLVAQTTNKEIIKGYNLVPDQISLDGTWAIYNKLDTEGNPPENTEFINIQTKKQVSLERNSAYYSHLLNDGITLKQTGNTLSIIKLETSQAQKEILNVKQFDSDKKNNRLFTLSNEGMLIIYQLTSKNQLEKFRQNNISIFFLNHDKTTLVYQDNSINKNLFYLDLKTLKKTEICSLKQDITTIKWNLSQDAILFDGEYNNSMLIHLPTLEVKQITFPKESINDKKIDFYSNNDLLITYNITTNQKYPESEYLDIWQGNSKHVIPSKFAPRYKIDYYAKIYKYQTEKYIELESGRNIQYSPIPIPGYVLQYDPLKNQDYLNDYIKNNLILKNIFTNKKVLLSSYRQNPLMVSPNNKHLLYPKEDGVNWEVFTPDTNKRIEIESDNTNMQTPLWSVDSKYIYFIKNNNLHKKDITTNKSFQLTNFSKDTEIIIRSLVLSPSNKSLIDNQKPLIIQITRNNQNAIYRIESTKVSTILPFTSNRIDSKMLLDPTFNTIVWMEENYNMPHKLNIYKNRKVTTLIENEIPKEYYSWQKRKDITFKNKYGKELEGFLFYPKNFDPKKSYPMVTHIYEEIRTSAGIQPNRFIQSTLRNGAGHNRTLLNEEGYFVFYPDTFVTVKDGPGISAVDCVERAIEKILEEEPSINKNKIGLDGFSFGGYKASFIASHSNTFATIISGGAPHDVIGSFYYRYSYDFRNKPDYSRAENYQFNFKESFGENPKKYLDNSPILFAQDVKTPILLITGLKDTNVFWQNTSSMYWALKRYNNTQVIALFYKDGEHALYSNPIISTDYTKRYLDWYNYYLKDDKTIQWIDNSVDPEKTSFSF